SPSTKSKRPKKRVAGEYVATEGIAAAPSNTSGTDEDLREAFEEVEQEKEMEELEEAADGPQEKAKAEEKEEEIPAEVIAESIALAQKQQEQQEGLMAELTGSELALFEDVKAEHSTATPAAGVQAEVSVTESVDQAIGVPEVGVVMSAAVPEAMVEKPSSIPAGVVAMVTSPVKPPIVAMPIHSVPGSRATASFADPELAEFEAMDLDAQLDRLEKLSSTPGTAKSRAVREAIERLKIWQSTELDEGQEAIDQLMKDLDLLHRHNEAPRPIIEMSLGLARDMLSLHNRYEDLKPTFATSEFCKATHEANLANYVQQKAELDQLVVGYKKAKATADDLQRHIEELQKQLAKHREVENQIKAELSSKTKATFLVQNMVSASKPSLEIAEASIHQGVLLQR
ncbi:unnamed protein product, partial [Prunus brigantina]